MGDLTFEDYRGLNPENRRGLSGNGDVDDLNGCPDVNFDMNKIIDSIKDALSIKQLAAKFDFCIDDNVAVNGKCSGDGDCGNGLYCEKEEENAFVSFFKSVVKMCRGQCKTKKRENSR